MALDLALKQRVECAAVVAIARQACDAILRVYNSEACGARGSRWLSTAAAVGRRRFIGSSGGGRSWRRASAGRAAPPTPALRGCFPRCPLRPQAEAWDVERKADDSPLTRADRDANAVICEGLARIGAAWLWMQRRPGQAAGLGQAAGAGPGRREGL